MARRLTGFTPSGDLHLGNYLGAIRPIVTEQAIADTVVFVSDLHALTLEHEPADVRRRTLEFATLLLAAGADPGACLFMVQSHVPEHTELHYLLECATGYGEAQRMIQFKEKARRQEQVRVSLLTYPVLMASDILLYDTEEVPVGEDQSQHVELARDVAIRFNRPVRAHVHTAEGGQPASRREDHGPGQAHGQDEQVGLVGRWFPAPARRARRTAAQGDARGYRR
jgi:tryptophanyl-tRNA synthetase